MKTTNLLIKEGKAFAVCEEIPEKRKLCRIPCTSPNNYGQCDCDRIESDYEKALQRVKDNAVEFENQDKAWDLIWRHDPDINSPISLWHYRNTLGHKHEGKIKTLTASVEVEFVEIPEYPTSYAPVKRVARIVEEKQCPKCRTLTPENCHSMHCPMRKEEKHVKVTFGIQPDQLAIIETERQRWKDIELSPELMKYKADPIYSKAFWDQTAKLVGWCPFTLAMHYLGKTVPYSEVEDQEAVKGALALNSILHDMFPDCRHDAGIQVLSKLKEKGFSITLLRKTTILVKHGVETKE